MPHESPSTIASRIVTMFSDPTERTQMAGAIEDAIRGSVAEATATAQKDREWGAARGAALTEIRKMLGVEWAGQDVVQAVRSVVAKLAEAETNNDICRGNYEGLAKELDAERTALAAERERCAKIADDWWPYPTISKQEPARPLGYYDGAYNHGQSIAAALRAQEGKA